MSYKDEIKKILKKNKELLILSERALARHLVKHYPDKFNKINGVRKALLVMRGKRYNYKKKIHKNTNTNAKILIFDIETSPMRAYTWGKWKQNIGDNQIVSDWFMLSWSAKWLFDDQVHSMVLNPDEVYAENDLRICEGLLALLNEADIVVAHNLLKFDEKRVNTRFLVNNLPIPTPYQRIDTLLHARKRFSITSNRLDYLAKLFGFKGKLETTGFELWKECMQGEEEALNKMDLYCRQDVKVLEDVYLAMRKWIKPHPNVGIMNKSGKPSCTTCGSDNLRMNGYYYTTVHKYQNYTCNKCGSHSRARKSELSTKESRSVLSSVPK